MPVKRGNHTRRGLSKALEKLAKPRGRGRRFDIQSVTTGSQQKRAARALAQCAQLVFNSVAHAACTFHVIPMKYKNGVCSLITSKLDKFVHYCVLFFLFARIMNLFYICSWLVFEEFNITTLLSLTILILFLFGLGLGCWNIFVSRKTVQLVNTWHQVLEILEQDRERPVHMFKDVALSLKIVGVAGFVLLVPLVLSASLFVVPDLPVFMQYQIRQVIPDLPEIWAQLIFCPFELMAGVLTNLIAAFGCCVLIISIGLVNLFGRTMRGRSLTTAAQYEQMREMFLFFKVYNAILDVWYKVVTPPAFFAASSTIVVFLYITFRHTELPIYIYIFCPYLALTIFSIQFGLCYDGLVVINATEETVSRLRSRHTKCFSRMSVKDKAAGLRWGKAMKPVVFNVGIFTEFNIAVPIGLWDEILNQLLFLLTL